MATKNNTTQNRARTVYGYYRVSSEPQTWGDGERRQDRQLKDFCARRGWTLSDRCFADRGVSAWKGKNRQEGAFSELLKVAKDGDVIAIEDNDRFSRERTVKSLAALEEIVNRGITVVFLKTGVEVTKENFNDPAVIIPNFFQSYLANQENEKRAYRIRQAMKARRATVESGKAVQGRLPAWLAWDKATDKPVIIKEKAKFVERIFTYCLEGAGVLSILKHMRSFPPLTKSKKANWNTRFIHRLLTDKSVIGFHSPTQRAGIYPAIISEEVFFTAAAKLKERKNLTVAIQHVNSSLFTGILKCSKCGHPIARQRNFSHGHVYRYLVCGGGMRGDTDCGCSGIPAELFEKSCLDFLGDADAIRPLLAGPATPSKVDELQGRLDAAQAKAAKLAALLLGDSDPSPVVYKALKDSERQAAELAAALEAELGRDRAEQPAAKVFEEFLAKLPALATDPAKRGDLRGAIASVVTLISVTPKAQRNAHGRYWTYTMQLRGRSDPVKVFCGPKPDDWAYRSLRPIEYIQPDANVVAVKSSLPAQVIPLVQQPPQAASLIG